MSFLDDIIDFGSDLFSTVSNVAQEYPIVTSLVRTAATGYVLNKVNQSINRENDVPDKSKTSIPDPGVRLQVDPDAQHRVPIVYGQAYIGGIITDVQLINNNLNLYVVFTISEQTGTKMSDSQASAISFENIFWDDKQIIFKADGITADHTLDRDGNIDYSIQDLVQIYCYSGNSSSPVYPSSYSGAALPAAWTIMPGWTANSSMSDLVFAIAKLTYNKDKGVTNIPKLTFQLENSMSMPGDVIYDYMINTRYGAGIPLANIYTGLVPSNLEFNLDSLLDLNNFGSNQVPFEDQRPYQIEFSSANAVNQSLNIVEDQAWVAPVGIDIVNCISQPANVSYQISATANVVATWDAIPDGTTLINTTPGVYTITGAIGSGAWAVIKSPTMYNKDATANFSYVSTITYPDPANVVANISKAWTTNVAITASSSEISTPGVFVFDEDQAKLITNPPQITDAYTGPGNYVITLTPNTTSAVSTFVSSGNASTSYNSVTRTLTITGPKAAVNENLGNIILYPYPNWSNNFSMTYSLTNPVSNLVTQVTQQANIGNIDSDFTMTTAYTYAEGAGTQLIFNIADSDPTATLYGFTAQQTSGTTGLFFVNGVNGGVGNAATFTTNSQATFNAANVFYVPNPDSADTVGIDVTTWKITNAGNVPMANVQAVSMVCTSSHSEYVLPSGTYDEDTFKPISFGITDTDANATGYTVSMAQTGANIGKWYINGANAGYANTAIVLSGSKASINANANIQFLPPVDYTGNINFAYSQYKTNTLFGNVTQANAVTATFTIGNTNPEVSNMISRSYTTNNVANIFSASTPQISDGSNVGQIYTITLSSSLGKFGNSAYNAYNGNGTYTFSGTMSQVNSAFANVVFLPPKNSAGSSGTFSYTQVRDGVTQVSNTVTLSGSVASFVPLTVTHTANGTYTADFAGSYFSANTAIILVGGGGGGGSTAEQNSYGRPAGGGGGGSVKIYDYLSTDTANVMSLGSTYTVTVGAGGGGANSAGWGASYSGYPGGSSQVVTGSTTYTAPGGDGGYSSTVSYAPYSFYSPGGGTALTITTSGGVTTGSTYYGANITAVNTTGQGGGAPLITANANPNSWGVTAATSTRAGNGAPSYNIVVNGISIANVSGGGGGGAGQFGQEPGLGGGSTGGRGAATNPASNGYALLPAVAGNVNTGGGGGGGTYYNNAGNARGAAGGSGVVYVRYY